MAGTIGNIAQWWAYVVWCTLREMWDDLPGPWWVKLPLIVAVLAIPGPQDELALLLVVRLCRAWRKRQARAATPVQSGEVQ